MPHDTEILDLSAGELETLKRLEQEAAQIDTGLQAEPSDRLVNLGLVTCTASGCHVLTWRGLALVRRHP